MLHGLRGRGYTATCNQQPSNHNQAPRTYGANGILIPPRDATALADAVTDAIEWLAQHTAERTHMGNASRELAESEFGIETVAKQTLALYL